MFHKRLNEIRAWEASPRYYPEGTWEKWNRRISTMIGFGHVMGWYATVVTIIFGVSTTFFFLKVGEPGFQEIAVTVMVWTGLFTPGLWGIWWSERNRASRTQSDPEADLDRYWRYQLGQEFAGNQHDWIWGDNGRIFGPLDHESGQIMTPEQFEAELSIRDSETK